MGALKLMSIAVIAATFSEYISLAKTYDEKIRDRLKIELKRRHSNITLFPLIANNAAALSGKCRSKGKKGERRSKLGQPYP